MKTYIGEIGGRTMKSLFFHNALLTSALFLVLLISGLPYQALAGVNIYFVHNDHLGTPVAVTDQSQAVVWEADKKPFGESVTTGTIGENTRFPGQLFDEETGLHYNYFRDYDPSLGRYIQSDRLGLFDGPNTYTYAYDNPLSYTDPTGEFGAVGAAIGIVIETGVQLARNGGNIKCLDVADILIAGAIGAVAPGSLSSLKSIKNSIGASRTFGKQLSRVKSASRRQKLNRRARVHRNRIANEVATQVVYQGGKAVAKEALDLPASGQCGCQ
jgi:RHS repeat-associated protein